MTLDEYVDRFRLLQHSAEKDERSLKLMSSGAYRAFLHRFENVQDPIFSSVLISEKALRKSLEKKQRLCERYALRLTRAISLLPPGELKEYALNHFLYGLTHEEIAEQSFYSVRTVYRYAKKAKEELRLAMLSIQPKLVRTEPGRYRVKGKLPRKEDKMDSQARLAAFAAALRRRPVFREREIFA